ncbi:MAG TPA: DUF4395 domain-containing protein [Kineosporiaceae bacterium]|nr:DUF4395 domain-containing protein [Kineosporiaceae bacterium]
MTATTVAAPAGIDPRGPRFAATLTTIVLALTVLTGNLGLLAAQTAVFAVGALAGAQATPYGVAFRRLLRPRLAPPAELEDPRPPRFAQGVGLLVTGTGLLLAVAGVGGAVLVSAAVALVAAFLNAAFGLCLGCEFYLVIARLRSSGR